MQHTNIEANRSEKPRSHLDYLWCLCIKCRHSLWSTVKDWHGKHFNQLDSCRKNSWWLNRTTEYLRWKPLQYLRHSSSEDKLLGNWIHVVTGHRALEFFKTQRQLSSHQMRWMEYLSRFNYSIQYVKGMHNKVADSLSHYHQSIRHWGR
jgi:hypothetical protein